LIGVNIVNSGDGMVEDKVYSGKEEKLVLVLLSDLYSKLSEISVDTSGSLADLILNYLLTI